MAAGEFSGCVDHGIELSKRIYYGKDVPPAPMSAPDKSGNYFPTALMVYAVVGEPGMVDNPDVPSYQPYVHGRCQPPALVPLHMYGVEMEVKCWLDYAAVTLNGQWRVNSVSRSRMCDCCLAIPLGEQGSVLESVELDVDGRSYHSQLVTTDDITVKENGITIEDGRFLKGYIYTLTIPQVEGGSNISVKLNWSQKLSYDKGHFHLNVPFTFPAYVNPVGKKISKSEKIMLNVNSGIGKEIVCGSISHPVKELRREVGKLRFLYEAEVEAWSNSDFSFSYTVRFSIPSSEFFGGVLLQAPPMHDFDQRQMFCLYMFPGSGQTRKVFKREIVFMLDISGSMKGAPLDNAKSAISTSLSKLTSQDSFNIIAFNGETSLFSPTMKLATEKSILNATQWLASEVISGGGTDIFTPLKQAMKLLSDTTDSVPLIFLITDGTVEDEREICKYAKEQLAANRSSISPRICTFGIGLHCNSYFLKMLAQIGSGHFDYAHNADSVEFRLQRFFTIASSVTLANVSVSSLERLDSLEIYPSQIPDLSSEYPLFLSGRYKGEFPDVVNVTGTLSNMSDFQIDLKAQNAKDVPLDKVCAKRQIDILTAIAWLSESKELEDKVAKLSIQTGTPSEYTPMILHLNNEGKKALGPSFTQKVFNSVNPLKAEVGYLKIILLGNLGVGFGNLAATTMNTPAGFEQLKSSNTLLVRATSSLYGKFMDLCCCMCCIRCLSHTSDRFTIWLTQLCAALACCECMDCCFELCECLG
ncbi:hypothetical protein ACFE04_021792 [Oxalis oulophora]